MITALLFFLAGVANGAMDTIKFNMNGFIWRTEWWLEQGEWAPRLRSWLLKHIVTMVSGGWHFMKFTMTALIIAGVLTYEPILIWYWDGLAFYACFSMGFICGYYFIWRSN